MLFAAVDDDDDVLCGVLATTLFAGLVDVATVGATMGGVAVGVAVGADVGAAVGATGTEGCAYACGNVWGGGEEWEEGDG